MLFPLVSLLMSGSLHQTVARTKRTAILIGVAVILFLTAYIFGLLSLALWLAPTYGAPVAVLFVAAGALVLGLIVLVVMAIINAQEARRARERKQALETLAVAGIGILRSQPLLTAAVAIAFLASNFIGTRGDDD